MVEYMFFAYVSDPDTLYLEVYGYMGGDTYTEVTKLGSVADIEELVVEATPLVGLPELEVYEKPWRFEDRVNLAYVSIDD